jgi:CRP-like cAMP-binding protein
LEGRAHHGAEAPGAVAFLFFLLRAQALARAEPRRGIGPDSSPARAYGLFFAGGIRAVSGRNFRRGALAEEPWAQGASPRSAATDALQRLAPERRGDSGAISTQREPAISLPAEDGASRLCTAAARCGRIAALAAQFATIGAGRKVVAFPKKQTIFTQGVAADAVFYIQKGKVRLTVVSKIGKEATLGILSEGEFFGEGSLAGQPLRMGSATAITDCELLRIDKKEMMLALHREHTFSDLFVAYLLPGTSDTKRI